MVGTVFTGDYFAPICAGLQDQKKPYTLNNLKPYVSAKDMKQIDVEL